MFIDVGAVERFAVSSVHSLKYVVASYALSSGIEEDTSGQLGIHVSRRSVLMHACSTYVESKYRLLYGETRKKHFAVPTLEYKEGRTLEILQITLQ